LIEPDGLFSSRSLEAEIWGAGLLDDAFDHPINGRIVPALEAGNLKSNKIGMPGRELRSPHFVVRAAGVGILPGIGDIERVADDTSPDFVPKQPLQHVFIERQGVLGEDRVAQVLELLPSMIS